MHNCAGTSLASCIHCHLFLRRLNAHLSSIVSSKPFQMPVDVVPRMPASSDSRLSSFGFSGTIAHGSFGIRKVTPLRKNKRHYSPSVYRNRRVNVSINAEQRSIWLVKRIYSAVELSQLLPGIIATKAPAVKVTEVSGIVKKAVEALTGTVVSENEPLIDAGIDSLSVAELVSTLALQLGIEIEPTALFDHPTVESLGSYLTVQMKSVQMNKFSKISPSLWSLLYTLIWRRKQRCKIKYFQLRAS